jgi:CHASE1-domain containing sensor protein
MWGRKRQTAEIPKPEEPPQRLKEALRKARVDQAERTGVVVDLHDAEVARLELLNEALEPLFAEIPAEVDLFDRGISRGETPRLWIEAVAHIVMGRDKRMYRFVQDTRYGRKVLAESLNIPEIVEAVTKYLAQRLIERERALAGNGMQLVVDPKREAKLERRSRRRYFLRAFLFGLIVGCAALVTAALLTTPRP